MISWFETIKAKCEEIHHSYIHTFRRFLPARVRSLREGFKIRLWKIPLRVWLCPHSIASGSMIRREPKSPSNHGFVFSCEATLEITQCTFFLFFYFLFFSFPPFSHPNKLPTPVKEFDISSPPRDLKICIDLP